MDRILYLDPWSGASGDMILASLVDAAGADLDAEQVLQPSWSPVSASPGSRWWWNPPARVDSRAEG